MVLHSILSRKNFSGIFARLIAPIAVSMGLLFPIAVPAWAVMEVDITRGNVRAIKIAIPSFKGSSQESRQIGDKIASIVRGNLGGSGMFEALDPQSYMSREVGANAVPRFSDWRVIKAEVLPVGNIDVSGGKIKAVFRLWDVYSGKQLTGQKFSANLKDVRRIAHIISDAIYERLTGEKGYFDSQIVFVDETGGKRNRVKRLAIMDQDGHNVRTLTEGKNLVLTPRFSPTRKEIAYMSYKGGTPGVYLLNIVNGHERHIGNFSGMSYAPRFSPDGRHIIFSLQEGGKSNVYTMALGSNRPQPITRHNSINTSPSYAPDGRQIVFESDRSGTQQLYVMRSDGQDQPRRISRGEGLYSTPVWSPRGDMIAFTKQYRGRFLIGVMRSNGTGERILTEGYHNEGPTWSPNGRVLMFFRDERGSQGPKLYSVDLTGHNEHQVSTPSFASDPAWSPVYK